MKKNQYMLAAAILAGGLIFVSTGQAQQQPGKGGPGKGQAKPGQGKAGPGKGQRPGQGKTRPGQGGQRPGQGRPQRGGGGFRGRNSYEGIGLSEEQQKKIDAIQKARTEEMGKLRESGAGGDRSALFAKYRELSEKYQKQTDAVLTDEQKKKMAEARAERSKGGGRGQGQPRPGGFSRSNPFASLGLKEEQQKKLDAARQEMSTQMRALFSRDSDTPREERTAKLQKAREAYEATIKKTLTAEQFKKYEAAQAARPERGQRRPGGGSTKPGGGRPRPDGKSKERPKRSDA